MVKTNFIHESDASKNTENIFDIKKEGKKFAKFNFTKKNFKILYLQWYPELVPQIIGVVELPAVHTWNVSCKHLP